jgi:hypothetical protein
MARRNPLLESLVWGLDTALTMLTMISDPDKVLTRNVTNLCHLAEISP